MTSDARGVEEDFDHVEDGGRGDSLQLHPVSGHPDNGQSRVLGQEISFDIPGKCHGNS